MTVMLKIRGEQRYEGQEPEVVELTTEGVMTQTAEGWSISYEETDLTGLQGATTTFTVKPSHITLTRTGTVQSSMVFQEGIRHESLYQLDVGALMVCVCARRIQTELSMEGGYLDVYYTIQIEQTMAGVVRYHIDVTPVK